jgi:hypothetical protein
LTRLNVTEKSFQAAVVQLARLTGWKLFYVRESVGSPHGWPDLVLCRGGVLLARELKTESGRLSAHQREWIAALEQCGIDVAVWRPRDWPTIEATLKGQLPLEVGS